MAGAVDETIAEVLEETLAHARAGRTAARRRDLRQPARAVEVEDAGRALARRAREARLRDAADRCGDAARGGAGRRARQSAEIDDAIAAVGQAQIVAASSPTYRALYTGVLKCFFDLMPQGHLAGKVCLGLQTGIAPQHALSPEYGLRPLFASLDGVPALALYATDAEFSDGEPSDALSERVARMAEQAVQLAHGLGPGEA